MMAAIAELPIRSGRWVKPWLFVSDKNQVLCIICPQGGAWIHKPRTRKGLAKALRTHRTCGYCH